MKEDIEKAEGRGTRRPGLVIERYTGYVSSIVYSLIGQALGQGDIEEVTADVFLALWEGREKVRPGKLRPWLSAVARHTAPEPAQAAAYGTAL